LEKNNKNVGKKKTMSFIKGGGATKLIRTECGWMMMFYRDQNQTSSSSSSLSPRAPNHGPTYQTRMLIYL
jgi:hypothetical protein